MVSNAISHSKRYITFASYICLLRVAIAQNDKTALSRFLSDRVVAISDDCRSTQVGIALRENFDPGHVSI
jgi:hypothetical protein